MKTKEEYLKLFAPYCSIDPLRPDMHDIFKEGGKHFATDGHTLIYIDEAICPDLAEENPKSPMPSKLPIDKRTPTFQISTTKLIEVLKTAQQINERIDCVECEGEGYQECNLGHDHECEYSDGNGFHGTDKLVPSPTQGFIINDTVMSHRYLTRLANTASTLEVLIIDMILTQEAGICLFQLGEVFVLIMPMVRKMDDYEEGHPAHIVVKDEQIYE